MPVITSSNLNITKLSDALRDPNIASQLSAVTNPDGSAFNPDQFISDVINAGNKSNIYQNIFEQVSNNNSSSKIVIGFGSDQGSALLDVNNKIMKIGIKLLTDPYLYVAYSGHEYTHSLDRAYIANLNNDLGLGGGNTQAFADFVSGRLSAEAASGFNQLRISQELIATLKAEAAQSGVGEIESAYINQSLNSLKGAYPLISFANDTTSVLPDDFRSASPNVISSLSKIFAGLPMAETPPANVNPSDWTYLAGYVKNVADSNANSPPPSEGVAYPVALPDGSTTSVTYYNYASNGLHLSWYNVDALIVDLHYGIQPFGSGSASRLW
ncbi:MAG: hypothetical protein J0H91_09555 [Rhodospirillales bacterium]|nr:hypothetical protein [Rhodospirillales bacterium]